MLQVVKREYKGGGHIEGEDAGREAGDQDQGVGDQKEAGPRGAGKPGNQEVAEEERRIARGRGREREGRGRCS